MRCFVAIALPDDIVDALETLQTQLRVGTLMDPATFHITLAFLDSQSMPVIEDLHEHLADIQMPDFPISIRGVDVFGGNAPRLVWAGVEPNSALSKLRETVRRAANDAGIDMPRQKFRPHVTLARVRGQLRGDEPGKLAQFLTRFSTLELPEFHANRFTLFRSTLNPDGAIHDPLAEYPLQ